MHSRIFQTSKKPIDKDDRYTSERFYDTSSDYFDYVDDSHAPDDLEWIGNAYKDIIDVDIENRTITLKNKKLHMIKTLISLAKASEKITSAVIDTLTDIIKNDAVPEKRTNIYHLIWDLQYAYEDKSGFHIVDDRYGDITFDEWLFEYGKDGEVLHVGNTFDYHL